MVKSPKTNNNGYTTPPVLPIKAANYGINDCDTAPIDIKITTTTTTTNTDRISEYHGIILDPIVVQILISFVYLSNWSIILLFIVIRNKMDTIHNKLCLNG